MTKANRLFTDEELKEFSKDDIMLANEALDRGDIDKARQCLALHQETKHWIHDHYVYWVSSLLSFVYKRFGEEAAADALKESYFVPMLGLEKTRKELGVKAYIQAWVDGILRHHSMIPGPEGRGGRREVRRHIRTLRERGIPDRPGSLRWDIRIFPVQESVSKHVGRGERPGLLCPLLLGGDLVQHAERRQGPEHRDRRTQEKPR